MSHKVTRVHCHGETDVGRCRDSNEDSMLVACDLGILAVADGMGGHAAGEVASRIAIETLTDQFSTATSGAETADGVGPGDAEAEDEGLRLTRAIHLANDRIFRNIELDRNLRGMGTTIVAAMIRGDRLIVGYVGDSRAYLLRDGTLRQLTADHSWVQEQVELGLLSPAEAKRHPFRNVVTRALGSREEVAVDTLCERLQPGDLVLLCSDGLNSMLDQERIREILQNEGGDVAGACRRLIEAANAAGGEDNTTVIVLRAEGEEADPAPA